MEYKDSELHNICERTHCVYCCVHSKIFVVSKCQSLNVSEVQSLLGTNVAGLKAYENNSLVRSWIRQQPQSELDKLSLGINGGTRDTTSGNTTATPDSTSSTNTLVTVAPTNGSSATNGGATAAATTAEPNTPTSSTNSNTVSAGGASSTAAATSSTNDATTTTASGATTGQYKHLGDNQLLFHSKF